MNTAGKRKRRSLTAAEHRERAQMLRRHATQYLLASAKQELMLLAIKHEVIAEELERIERDEP